jgi:hypothetical protein
MPESPGTDAVTPELRLQQVQQRVHAAEQRFGREPGSVQILPVSKTRPAQDIARVTAAGISAFGESYLQEAQEKIAALAELNLQWHFIGPIQSNKTQAIASLFDWVHSVEREKIARRLNEQRPTELPPLNICLQVNISGEASKSGVTAEMLPALAQQVKEMPRLRLRGLMAIPARAADFEAQRAAFRGVREAFEALQRRGFELDTLSMGMSGDLEAAIAEGATMVRVGTDIFGTRQARPADH